DGQANGGGIGGAAGQHSGIDQRTVGVPGAKPTEDHNSTGSEHRGTEALEHIAPPGQGGSEQLERDDESTEQEQGMGFSTSNSRKQRAERPAGSGQPAPAWSARFRQASAAKRS